MEEEQVQAWVRRCPEWQLLGTFETDDEGVVKTPVPTDLAAGEYAVRFVVLGDLVDEVIEIVDADTANWQFGERRI